MPQQTPNFLSRRADLAFMRQLLREPLLEREVEQELALRWQRDQCEESLHQLIKAYSRLVISIASKFKHYGLPMNDLIQEGNIGLLEAAQRFEPERQVRFSTYAKWWIRAMLQDFVLRNWSIVRTGSTTAQKQLFFNLNRLRRELFKIHQNMDPTLEKEKIAEILNVTMNDIEEMEARLHMPDVSINNPIKEDSSHSLEDKLMDHSPDPEALVIKENDAILKQVWINEALDALTEREKDIIVSRRLSDPSETLEEIGRRHHVSKERVRQLETKALRKMRYLLINQLNSIKDII